MRYGWFDNENREYVIDRPDVPASWTNYLGVQNLCTVVSHNAGGYSFYKSAEHGRITRFRPNGVPLDRPGHYCYIRDDDTGEYWSISWQPVGKDLGQARHECRHGLSYSRFTCDYRDLNAEQTIFIPLGDDVELWDVRIRNHGTTPRRLSVFGYVEFSFHHIEIDNQNLQMSLYASGSSYRDSVIEYDFFYEPWTFHYFTAGFEAESFDSLRDSFIGSYRTETNPIALERGHCGNRSELGGNHCGALHTRVSLPAGESVRLAFMLGVGPRDKGRQIRAKYSSVAAVDAAFAGLRSYWQEKLAAFQSRTPHPGLDTMINTWTLYQAETCVVWSRFASFIEVGGRTGLGYRDTSQDVMSVAHTNPAKCRQRIIELLQGQVSQGYGLHLFDPDWFDPEKQTAPKFKSPTVTPSPDRKSIIHGLADVCSDDALWLVVSICEYAKETGETALFDEVVPFADEGQATVYEHLKRALDFSAEQIGPTGICKGLRADWNDCLNLGGGESALVSFLHHWALRAFVEAAEYLGRTTDSTKYCRVADKVRETCESELWDGEWYIRGITSSGVRIGTHESEEGKIFLESNTWAVASDLAPPERARSTMDAIDRYLFSEYGIHLLWPAFSKPNDEIGFVTRVYKGIKENAAIFSHPNPWAVIAECKLGRGDRAMKFYDALLPYHQNDCIETREAEPYSYCQFVMGRDHTAFGRARHPWLTGSGGWSYTAATRWILGVRPGFDGLIVDPCIPADWKEFQVTRRWRGATYHITVRNPHGVQKGVRATSLNGIPVVAAIPPQPAGSANEVSVEMG
ncbi:N,N'-diacetylchitobiose phosphorylase [Candidatus Sulfopaludibacter sp. SbA6]|nr:N,N'-diacetylchitobiose phosphorylase [Candidatus Sulfopaludibacter sp. SbA6]